ncbi:MAG: DUF429 domain-containing protein [Acidimicrobiales bacterium]|nr:DUF429 domain-containing protein [Acidimicrobiales bacterium]
MTTVLGVDGSRGGWVGVRWDGTTPTPCFEESLADLCRAAGPVDVVAVDMPIGLEARGPRACDTEVRPLLGPRRSSLFAPPARGALDCDDYAAANAWSKAHVGHGLSKQAWMLAPKIREVRALAATEQHELFEAFPELSFLAMNGDRFLSHAKRTWTGMATRLELLDRHGLAIEANAGRAGDVAADDMIDAAALAWSGMRIATGRARHAPAELSPGTPSIWW